MKPNLRFLAQNETFWANVRTISQQAGYTVRGQAMVKVPALEEMAAALRSVQLQTTHLIDKKGRPTALGRKLLEYYDYRADVLNNFVEPRLMDAQRAQSLFNELKPKCWRQCPLPLNKQKGKMKAPAYFTCVVNMLIEAHSKGHPCDYDPRTLTTVTRDGAPLRTLARRLDGAFPSTVNPIAVWEIKEYYYTTTFGSRVADGVYESLLDGMELKEIREHDGVDVKHYLFLDAHYTWWDCGKSYLCRIIDMLHMGYVDEVLFGYEVVEELPRLVAQWTALAKKRGPAR
ncbi:MAG: hypothetical protein ACLQLG_08630 [Thermoguttaceae bacterium]